MNGQIRRSQREQQQPSPPPPDILQLSFPPTPPPLSHLTLIHNTSNRFIELLFQPLHCTATHICAQKKAFFLPHPVHSPRSQVGPLSPWSPCPLPPPHPHLATSLPCSWQYPSRDVALPQYRLLHPTTAIYLFREAMLYRPLSTG